jgi:ATP-dependent DNA helicase RecQ/Werner syndrome ATP-dependent helicase
MKFRQDSTNLCSWILVLALVALSQGFLTCNQVKMADEFGDDSFLLDLDLDEIVQKRASAATPSAGAVKRLKRSPLHALPQNVRMGDKSDPEKELATELDAPQTISGGASTSVVPLVKPLLTAALEKTLSMHFGFNSFRKGQLEVIQAVLEQRDVAVFWATGQGKSLCYQIPALHTGHVGIVVSPLISLMEDQVHKLNGLTDKPLATFLGSGQLDPTMETRALQGEFTLVYVTPEKMLSLGFLDRLSHLHQTKKRLCLVAIDESHCVSEWGHDFRPEYRRLGEIREHPILSEVPMLALTATAIPRVQEDIVSSLGLNHPFMARQSFDRQNLIISVQKKRSGGIHSTLQPLLPKLEDKCSTIIYAPTRDQVTEIASYLSQKLPSSIRVQAYHAGMTTEQRSEAHTNFLVGKTSIICSTVAFGMVSHMCEPL